MHIRVGQITGQRYLAGAADGLAARSVAQKAIGSGLAGPLLILDFRDVTLATASYLREFVFGLRDCLQSDHPEIQLVVANAAHAIEDEIRLLTRALNTAIVVCDLGEAGPANARIVGSLDPAMRRAMALVLKLGAADAGTLQANSPDESNLSATAWNNRLAALKDRGLVIEERQDRRKIFRPVLGGLTLGS